ncbi:MAG: RNA polymerase sigma factor [Parvibaculaceae bacterium]
MTRAPGLPADAVRHAARASYGKLVACLSIRCRDMAKAEDALAQAFLEALERWPASGVPESPEAWLLTVARRQLADGDRRMAAAARGSDHLRLLAEEIQEDGDAERSIPDERLRLMFACAHPAIDTKIRAPLILQTVLGFDAATIARAFLVAPAAMAQRLVRAKAKIRDAGIPFRVPERGEWAERIDAVLAAIYAAFSAGWSDPLGADVQRKNLADEAIWLARLMIELAPEEPEALGLLSLLLHLDARRGARRVAGRFVPLQEQDTALWHSAMIGEADALLGKASRAHSIGRYQVEAAIQSAHAIRRLKGRPDWPALEKLYDRLFALTRSPVVALNRAVVVAETQGAQAGIAALDDLSGDMRLHDYQPYWAARADLMARLAMADAANAAYLRAIGLETDPAVRAFLEERRRPLAAGP